MIVSHKYKFIYLATSKTATTSIYNQLSKYDEAKLEKHSVLDILSFDYSDYFIFCFVRNPWERLLSGYLQSKKAINLHNPYRKYIYELSNRENFTGFLKLVDNRFWHDYDQSRYYLNKGRLIDFVGRFENLNSDFRIVCHKLYLEYRDLPHYNKSNHKNYRQYYDAETKDMVSEKYAKDVEYFGYEY